MMLLKKKMMMMMMMMMKMMMKMVKKRMNFHSINTVIANFVIVVVACTMFPVGDSDIGFVHNE